MNFVIGSAFSIDPGSVFPKGPIPSPSLGLLYQICQVYVEKINEDAWYIYMWHEQTRVDFYPSVDDNDISKMF